MLLIYGFLKMIPSDAILDAGPINIGPEFIGGVLFPGLIFGLITLAPWLDRSNHRGQRFEYLEPPTQAPARLAAGVAVLVFIGTLFLAAYYDEIGMKLWMMWAIALLAPLASAVLAYGFAWTRSSSETERFDPTAAPEEPSLASTAD